MISEKRLAEINAIPDEDINTSDISEANEQFFRQAYFRKRVMWHLEWLNMNFGGDIQWQIICRKKYWRF